MKISYYILYIFLFFFLCVGKVNASNIVPVATNVLIGGIPNFDIGQTFVGYYHYSDVDNDPEGNSTFKWYRDNVEIPGATSLTYTITEEDIGHDIKFEVTPVALSGSSPGLAVQNTSIEGLIEITPVADPTIDNTPDYVFYSAIDGNIIYEGSCFSETSTVFIGVNTITFNTLADGIYNDCAIRTMDQEAINNFFLMIPLFRVEFNNAYPRANNVSITGTPKVGETLSASYTYFDSDADPEGNSTFKWYRDNVEIPGATSLTYILVAQDSGHNIKFEVTPVALSGSSPGLAVQSSAIELSNAPPVATNVSITGTLKVGEVLTGHYTYSDSDGDQEGVSIFRWLRDDNTIANATSLTYTITAQDSGHNIKFEITPVASSGLSTGLAVQSSAIELSNAPPVATNVSITGTLKVGEVLTGHYTYSDVEGFWKSLGDPGSVSTGEVWFPNIKLDNIGNTYVSYGSDVLNGYKGAVRKYNSNTNNWDVVGSNFFTCGWALSSSLALDSNGVPYFAFEDSCNNNKLTVMKFDGTSWVTVGTAGFTINSVKNVNFSIDKNNILYVAYKDMNNKKMTVMKFDGTSWVTVGTQYFSDAYISSPSLSFDKNNILYVAYVDSINGGSNGYGGVTVKKFDGTSWVTVGTAGFTPGALSVHLTLDNNNEPFIIFSNVSTNKATVMKFDGNSWVSVGNNDSSSLGVALPNIAINNKNVPYIVYQDSSQSDKATVKKFDGNSWVTVGIAGFSLAKAYSPTLDFDSNGVPYVTYEDFYFNTPTVVSRGTVMKFTDSDLEGNSTFKWYRDNVEIPGATSLTYTITEEDIGHDIKFEVTPVALTGMSPGLAVQSNSVSILNIPSVVTELASSITNISAVLNGNVTNTGGVNSTILGFQYGLTTDYGMITTEEGLFATGSYTGSISSLLCGTTYHYRAYATNTAGTGYGNDEIFNTVNCSSVRGGYAVIKPQIALQNSVISTPTSILENIKNNFLSQLNLVRFIKQGTIKTTIKTLQQFLNSQGYIVSTTGSGSTGNETNYFGLQTKKALIKFQKANNLNPDGILGPKTKEVIKKIISKIK